MRAGEAGGDPSWGGGRVGSPGLPFVAFPSSALAAPHQGPTRWKPGNRLRFLMPSDLEPCLHTRFFQFITGKHSIISMLALGLGRTEFSSARSTPNEHFKSLASPECRLIKNFYIFIIKIGAGIQIVLTDVIGHARLWSPGQERDNGRFNSGGGLKFLFAHGPNLYHL